MSEIKVNSIKGVGASAAAITVNNTDGSCTAVLTSRQGKNLVVNGGMTIAQRSTSSTDQLYSTVDRIRAARVNVSANPTFAQVDVASGTTPYSLGFRKAFKITNASQSGSNTNSVIAFSNRCEARNVAISGWNYTSTSSYITLQCWVKSSVAQNFYIRLFTQDGTQKNYPMETGSLTADTWTKITKTIPGHADLQFDNDFDRGLDIDFSIFRGTDQTASGVTLNQWANLDDTAKIPDMTSTWYTTNAATFEITGLQLEVGQHASDFEIESQAETLAKCQRYFEICRGGVTATGVNSGFLGNGVMFRVTKRATPTITRISDYQIGNVNTPYSDLVDVNGFQAVAQHDGSGNMKFATKYSAEAEL